MQTVTFGSGEHAVTLPRTAALAPMASVADRAYRTLCMEAGAAWCVGELTSAKAIAYGDLKSARLLASTPAEQPMAIQLFGSEPKTMAFAAEFALRFSPKAIDVNMGCPVPKVAGSGCGAALMKTPELAAAIVREMVKAAAGVPVTVKFRKGWDDQSVNAVEFAKRMEAAGAAALTVHGRTRAQMYRPPVDLSILRAVREAVLIPVIGNGGVACGADAKRMYDETGCDLVMLGQGSYGRPWVFAEIAHYLETGESLPEPPIAVRMDTLLRQVRLMLEDTGETAALRQARKHCGWYAKGARGAAEFRRDCCSLERYAELEERAARLIRENEGGEIAE